VWQNSLLPSSASPSPSLPSASDSASQTTRKQTRQIDRCTAAIVTVIKSHSTTQSRPSSYILSSSIQQISPIMLSSIISSSSGNVMRHFHRPSSTLFLQPPLRLNLSLQFPSSHHTIRRKSSAGRHHDKPTSSLWLLSRSHTPLRPTTPGRLTSQTAASVTANQPAHSMHLPSHTDHKRSDVSSATAAAISHALRNVKDKGPNVQLDTDGEKSNDEALTSASMSAFAKMEAQMRAKKRQRQQKQQVAVKQVATVSSASSESQVRTDEEAVASASMSAFARMEAQMRARKKKQQQGAMQPPTSDSVSSTPPISPSKPTTSWRLPAPLEALEEPAAESCCGRDCPNCVWITYSEQLADYEERKAKMEIEAKQHINAPTVLVSPSSSQSTASAAAPASIHTLASSSGPCRPLTPFERAMESERRVLSDGLGCRPSR